MEKTGVLDRIEGDKAVIELDDGNIIWVYACNLRKDAREGSVSSIDDDRIILLEEETKKRREEIQKLMDDLFID